MTDTIDTFPMPAHGFTCFHCGETFTTPGSARHHFGFEPSAEPGCRIKVGAERGLLMAIRKAEEEIQRLHTVIEAGSSDGYRALAAQAGRYYELVRSAEELGYERGLAEARSALAGARADTSKWQPIETAPLDEEILAAINVIHANGKTIVERHIIYIQSDTREIAGDYCMGWNAAEYTSWHPLPPTQETE